MPLRAGDMHRRITLQRYDVTFNADNEPNETWTPDAAAIWASWRRASARETLASAEVRAAVSDIFEIRFSSAVSNLNAKDRLVYDGRTYDISGVTEIGRREGLRIEASARADQ